MEAEMRKEFVNTDMYGKTQRDFAPMYDKFYTGENRKEIHRLFCRFLECIRSDDFSDLENICSEDCIAEFSTVGKMAGIPAIARGLKWPGPECNVRKVQIWNFVARSSKEGKGQQCSYVQNCMAIDDGVNLFPFLYGGQFCNSYEKRDGVWKMTHIRFDLAYEFGNNLFVRKKWELMDPAVYNGHWSVINSELDAPWWVIPEDCEPQSDEEQVLELQFEKIFGMDNGDFHLTLRPVVEDHFQNFKPRGYYGKRDYNNFLKGKYHKENRLQHANRMTEVYVDGDTAVAWMPRGEDHRLRNRVYNRINIHSMVSTGGHKVWARKEDGRWKIYRMRTILVPTQFDYLDDSVLHWDEHVVGGRKWLDWLQ